MKKALLALLITFVGFGTAQAADKNFMEFGAKDFKQEDYKTSNWLFELGYNYLPYELILPAYEGKYEEVEAEQTFNLSGLSLGFGGQVYFGGGFSSTIKVNGTHYRSFEDVTASAAEDLDDSNLAEYKLDYQMNTADATMTLDYLIETSWVGVQPFIGFSVGIGEAKAKRDYEYDEDDIITVDSPENYNVEATERFNYNKLSVGVNFISSRGLTSYITVSQMSINKTEREFKGSYSNQTQTDFDVSTAEGDEEIDENSQVTVASIGLGYMF